jgi:hypothetical protein
MRLMVTAAALAALGLAACGGDESEYQAGTPDDQTTAGASSPTSDTAPSSTSGAGPDAGYSSTPPEGATGAPNSPPAGGEDGVNGGTLTDGNGESPSARDVETGTGGSERDGSTTP